MGERVLSHVLDKRYNGKHERMISYMADLMEDTTNFSWRKAKTAHAILCCELERGTVTWEDVSRIDRIRTAHAQKHVPSTKSWGRSEGGRKPWFCKFLPAGCRVGNSQM